MRLALLLTVTIACSTGKRDEGAAPMPPTPSTPAAAYTGPKVFVQSPSGEVEVKVEVVSTPVKIQKGLMFREHLPLDGGMLFLMPKDEEHPFWMRNTLIKLDMLWISGDMKVVGIIENAEPMTETLRTIGKPSRYVLEVNGGWTQKHGVTEGALVRFENVK